VRPLDLSWPVRILLGLAAFLLTAVYTASFLLDGESAAYYGRAALQVGVAAGVSWLLFGGVLLAITRLLPGCLAWADACLVTMLPGNVILLLSAALNLLLFLQSRTGRTPMIALPGTDTVVSASVTLSSESSIHLLILLLADAVMCFTFVRQAKRLEVAWPLALFLWVVVQNGIFAVFLFAMIRTGVPFG
jgi:hypothetical protein